MEKSNKKYLTPNEVAELLMVSPITVRQWAQKGELRALTTPGGHRRFLYRDVEAFARANEIAFVPQEEAACKVLVVDDDQMLAQYLVEQFSQLTVPVITDVAHDGFEAGQKVLQFKPNVVLLDLMMPGLKGFQVCRLLREDPATRAIRIVTMTGYYSQENVKQALDAGADVCLKKPLNINELLSAMGLPGTATT